MQFYYEHTPERKWAHTFVCVSRYDWPLKQQVLKWCKEHFGPIKGRFRFSPYNFNLAFMEECDAVLFRMQWVTTITDVKPKD